MLHLVCSILGMNFKCAQIKLSRAVRRIIAAGEEKAELAKWKGIVNENRLRNEHQSRPGQHNIWPGLSRYKTRDHNFSKGPGRARQGSETKLAGKVTSMNV